MFKKPYFAGLLLLALFATSLGNAANINKWSQTAVTNATADPDINWSEGQDPGTVNDSARQMMRAIAKDRDDTRGALITSGTSTAYTLTTNSVNTAYQDGLRVSAVINVANGTAPTLNVDSVGAKPIWYIPTSGAAAIPSGTMAADFHAEFEYDASLNSASGVWVLVNAAGASSTTATSFIGGTSTNSGNAYTLATLAGFGQTTGYQLSFTPNAANTGASTLAITSPSISATNIFRVSPSGPIALTGGELQTSQLAVLVFDGTRYILTNPAIGTAALLNTGTAAGNVVKLDGSAKLPAVDGSQLTNISAAAGVLVNIQQITSSGTYTPTSGCTKAFAAIIGGGGSGGSSGTGSASAGAGSGASGSQTYLFISSPTSTSITIGAGGATKSASGAGGAVGNAGGQTSFGTVTAPGGLAGGAANGAPGAGGATGGPGSNGTWTVSGIPGDNANMITATPSFVAGNGGSNPFGTGGAGASASNGGAGQGFGAGGAGASGASNTGGAGTSGAVIVWEYK